MAGPLSHLRVLDLSRILAAPWAAQNLADMGADVIKVERPGAGDDTRSWGPPFLQDSEGRRTDNTGYFLAANRGKRSITIDLAKPEGQALVRQLAARSDIVLENYKAGTLQRYGLDYDSLRQVKPDIIYCSVTGFGQDGPRRDQAAYDFAIQAMGGLMSITGERDDRPGGGPQKVGVPLTDIMTGMYATVAVLAAVAKREKTGEGDYIDLAMLDVQAAVLANQAMNFLIGGVTPKRNGNRHPNIQPQDVYPCADGHLVLAVGNDTQFAKVCEVVGRPEWAADARFASNAQRVAHIDVLNALLAERFRDRGREELTQALGAAGVPCGPLNTIPQVFEDAQIRHRGLLQRLPHPLAGEVPQVVSPLRFRQAPLDYTRAPPLLGQHTEEVLREIGLDTAAIAALQQAKVV